MGDYPINEIDVPWLGRLSVSQLGLPTFTFLIGLVDGFNPCAMWVLIFLLSVLVNLKDRKKILIVAGTFVVVSGLAYFVFMAAWFNVFQLIGLLRPVQVGSGIVAILVGVINIKDFFAFHKGVSLSIPESAKPGIYRRVRQVVSANSERSVGSGDCTGRCRQYRRTALHRRFAGTLHANTDDAGPAALGELFLPGVVHCRLHAGRYDPGSDRGGHALAPAAAGK